MVILAQDMEASLGVPISPCETEINQIDLIVVLADTHQKVSWFDVAVNQVTRVDKFNVQDLSGCN